MSHPHGHRRPLEHRKAGIVLDRPILRTSETNVPSCALEGNQLFDSMAGIDSGPTAVLALHLKLQK